ncbi:nuclear transport factor 2 family protein, partial [Limnohabitans sp. Rim8]
MNKMTMVNFETHLALTRLYADYALAVDSGQWDLWPDFFADDCSYRL